MLRTPLLALAMLSATAAVAQNYATQSQAAPIERAPASNDYVPHRPDRHARPVTTSQPAPGVLLRVGGRGSVETVSSDTNRVELRVDHGRANISVHDPAAEQLILVDLPGGQTQLLKNGLYTFNATTNTVRVLKGEANAFPGESTEPIKVKEDHEVAFGRAPVQAVELDPYQIRADLLPGARANSPRYTEGFYGDGPFDYGFYGDPYYAFGYPGFYGYPYGYYGGPFGLGFGFGYYGGFGYRGGGFRGHR